MGIDGPEGAGNSFLSRRLHHLNCSCVRVPLLLRYGLGTYAPKDLFLVGVFQMNSHTTGRPIPWFARAGAACSVVPIAMEDCRDEA